jgi:hypothetical protein
VAPILGLTGLGQKVTMSRGDSEEGKKGQASASWLGSQGPGKRDLGGGMGEVFRKREGLQEGTERPAGEEEA